MSIFKKVLSVGGGKLASELNTIVDAINDKEQEFEKLSNEEIKTNFQNLSDELNDNPFSIEVEAFAYIREAAKRTIGQRHYDVQIFGGLVLLRNKITEMKTGEGKTLVSTLPISLMALFKKGVHVVTVNEYLAKRLGSAQRSNIIVSRILGGGSKEYDYILESLQEQGKIIVETVDGKWKPHSKITLVNTEG